MFGRRQAKPEVTQRRPRRPLRARRKRPGSSSSWHLPRPPSRNSPPPQEAPKARKSQEYYDLKTLVFGALIETLDIAALAKLDARQAREEVRGILTDIFAAKKVVMSTAEQEDLLVDVTNDVLGYGPLEPLLARDDIADIMVNGPDQVYIEVNGKVEEDQSGSATAPSFSTSASASSARSAAGSTSRARSATRACPTARASTSSPRRSPSTAPR
jgi:pilus assembly protein CpaF